MNVCRGEEKERDECNVEKKRRKEMNVCRGEEKERDERM